MFPFSIGSKIGEVLQTAQLKAKDSRIKLMNEILSGIKVLKLYAWEIPFIKRILEKRQKELNIIKKYCVLNAFNNFTYACSPILITLGMDIIIHLDTLLLIFGFSGAHEKASGFYILVLFSIRLCSTSSKSYSVNLKRTRSLRA